jgi:DNA repair ATPase RecN
MAAVGVKSLLAFAVATLCVLCVNGGKGHQQVLEAKGKAGAAQPNLSYIRYYRQMERALKLGKRNGAGIHAALLEVQEQVKASTPADDIVSMLNTVQENIKADRLADWERQQSLKKDCDEQLKGAAEGEDHRISAYSSQRNKYNIPANESTASKKAIEAAQKSSETLREELEQVKSRHSTAEAEIKETGSKLEAMRSAYAPELSKIVHAVKSVQQIDADVREASETARAQAETTANMGMSQEDDKEATKFLEMMSEVVLPGQKDKENEHRQLANSVLNNKKAMQAEGLWNSQGISALMFAELAESVAEDAGVSVSAVSKAKAQALRGSGEEDGGNQKPWLEKVTEKLRLLLASLTKRHGQLEQGFSSKEAGTLDAHNKAKGVFEAAELRKREITDALASHGKTIKEETARLQKAEDDMAHLAPKLAQVTAVKTEAEKTSLAIANTCRIYAQQFKTRQRASTELSNMIKELVGHIQSKLDDIRTIIREATKGQQ